MELIYYANIVTKKEVEKVDDSAEKSGGSSSSLGGLARFRKAGLKVKATAAFVQAGKRSPNREKHLHGLRVSPNTVISKGELKGVIPLKVF